MYDFLFDKLFIHEWLEYQFRQDPGRVQILILHSRVTYALGRFFFFYWKKALGIDTKNSQIRD